MNPVRDYDRDTGAHEIALRESRRRALSAVAYVATKVLQGRVDTGVPFLVSLPNAVIGHRPKLKAETSVTTDKRRHSPFVRLK